MQGRDDISQLAITINRMLDRVERSYGSQQHFVTEAQNRLNAPLSRASQAVDELAATDLSGHQRLKAAESARRQMEFMRRTLAYLDVLAEADKPGFLRRTTVGLKELTTQGYASVAQSYPQRRWVLEHTADGYAWLDARRVDEALRQICRNAVDHTDTDDTIRLGSEVVDQGHTVRLWVANHGEPLTQDQAERLLEAYRSSESADDESSMGLGLAIVRAVADAHGGAVWVESDPQDGTRFGLDLPVRDDQLGYDADSELGYGIDDLLEPAHDSEPAHERGREIR